MPKRLSGWLIGAAFGVLLGGILAMDAVADARAATIVVEVEVGGTPAEGVVQILGDRGAILLEGASRQPLRVTPGTYAIRVSCPAVGAVRVLHDVPLAERTTVRRVVRFAQARR